MAEQIKVFISYSRQDKKQIHQLYQALSGDDELEVFLDEHDIAAAENWKERLENLIRAADTVIFATSPASAASDICRWEVELAAALNKRILPVILKDVPDGTVPDEIARLNYIFLRNNAELKPALISIGEALKIDIDWVREHTRLSELAHRWDLATQLGAQPLRGKELEGAESWLASQPKDAPPPTEQQRSYIYQSRKAATQRQRVLVSGSLVALLVVGVLGVFAWLQRGAAIEARELAQANEARAMQALRSATETADTLVFDLALEFKDSGLPTKTIKSVLDKALGLQGKLSENFPGDVPLLSSRLSAVSLLIDLYQKTDDFELIEETAKAGLEIADSILGVVPTHLDALDRKAAIQRELGKAYMDQFKVREAEAAFEAALATTHALSELIPDDQGPIESLVDGYIGLGDMKLEFGDLDAALIYYEDADELASAAYSKQPEVAPMKPRYGIVLGRLSNVFYQQLKIADALSYLEKSNDIYEELLNQKPNNTNYLWNLSVGVGRLGDMYLSGGKIDKAGKYFTLNREYTTRLYEMDPSNLSWQKAYVISLHRSAKLSDYLGDLDSTLSFNNEALKLLKDIQKKQPSRVSSKVDLAVAFGDIGFVYQRQGEMDLALATYNEGLKFSEAALILEEESHSARMTVSDLRASLAWVAREQKDFSAEIEHRQQGVKVLRLAYQDRPNDKKLLFKLQTAVSAIADAFMLSGNLEGSEIWRIEAAKISKTLWLEREVQQNFASLVRVSNTNLALLQRDLRKFKEATYSFYNAFVASKTLALRDPVSDNYVNLRNAAESFGDLHRAISARDDSEVLEDFLQINAAYDNLFQKLWKEYPDESLFAEMAILIRKSFSWFRWSGIKDFEGAEAQFIKSFNLITKLSETFPQNEIIKRQIPDLHDELGNFYFEVGRREDARASYDLAMSYRMSRHTADIDDSYWTLEAVISNYKMAQVSDNPRPFLEKGLTMLRQMHEQGVISKDEGWSAHFEKDLAALNAVDPIVPDP